MTAGYFKRIYEVWRSMLAQNPSTGEMIRAWAKLADVPGRAYKHSLTYRVAAGAPTGLEDWTFACAADTDLVNGDQVRFDGRTLDVQAISVTSRGDRIEALCKEVQ